MALARIAIDVYRDPFVTHEAMMRTTIEIDDALMKAAMEATEAKTKREVVDMALRALVGRRLAHRELMKLKGKIKWEGDLDAMRRDR